MNHLIEMTEIEVIYQMWSEDSKIDDVALDDESLKIPKLHSRYVRILIDERRQLQKMRETHKILHRDKVDYYSGRMGQEDLDERGWQPLDIRILKTDVPKYVEGDRVVVNHLIQISEQNEKVQLLVSIMDNIKWRSQHIKNAIEWRKFLGGAN
jgi:hypothetical protein|tara:strand:+ start:8171 stop:8629 length:459 start_codon:yes stop_codon:yes gene_type:complete